MNRNNGRIIGFIARETSDEIRGVHATSSERKSSAATIARPLFGCALYAKRQTSRQSALIAACVGPTTIRSRACKSAVDTAQDKRCRALQRKSTIAEVRVAVFSHCARACQKSGARRQTQCGCSLCRDQCIFETETVFNRPSERPGVAFQLPVFQRATVPRRLFYELRIVLCRETEFPRCHASTLPIQNHL